MSILPKTVLEKLNRAYRDRYGLAVFMSNPAGKRVRKAEEMLLHADQSYTDIAYSLGFSDQSYFIKQFRETTGLTPAKFRYSS